MADIDTGTPEVKLVQRLADAYHTLDMKNVEPFLSKNYQFEVAPGSADLPKQTKESHIRTWGQLCSAVKRLEVRIRHRRTSLKLRHPQPLDAQSRSDRRTRKNCPPSLSLYTEPLYHRM
jgi:hypothetical protein